MIANFLGFDVDTKKVEKLVKSKSWTNNRGETVQPKQPWKLDQYGKDGLYFDGLLKIFQVYNNTDTPGNRKKLTFRAYFVTEDGNVDHDAMTNFKSFVDAFQKWAYENRDNLPWQWSKGKSIAEKLKEIAAKTDNATFEDIMTSPKWQKYKTKTNEDTGEDIYLNWDKEEIGTVNPNEPPPAGAVVIGNQFFSNRVKKDREGNYYAEFDMNLDKYDDVVDATTTPHVPINLTDITEGVSCALAASRPCTRSTSSRLSAACRSCPWAANPKLEVLFMNPRAARFSRTRVLAEATPRTAAAVRATTAATPPTTRSRRTALRRAWPLTLAATEPAIEL